MLSQAEFALSLQHLQEHSKKHSFPLVLHLTFPWHFPYNAASFSQLPVVLQIHHKIKVLHYM